MKLAGLDIGTTGCKVVVYDEEGNALGREYEDYPVSRGAAHEMDGNVLKNSVLSVLKAAAKKFPDIGGIGITSFGESFLLVDEAGQIMFPIMLYTDPRGEDECRELVDALGREKLISITGLSPHGMYSLPKVMWVKKHRPEIFRKVKYILLIQDYIVWLLTGKRQIDFSLATRTMAFDIRSLNWNREILDCAGLDGSLFSHPVPTGTAAGNILPRIAAETGLRPETKIVSISHDQVACAVGAGVFEEGVGVDGAGTVECITPVFGTIPEKEFQKNFYNVVPYLGGKYVSYAFTYTGGALLQWCIDELLKKEKEWAAERGISIYTLLEEGEYHPTGLLVLPHFAGAATPYMDVGSKGAIVGLTAATKAKDLYHACMEGVAYEMRLNMERIKSSGIRIERLIATGGGARSSLWMQMKADILGVPIETLSVTEAGTAGSAMLTGIAIGIFRDPKEAAARFVRRGGTFVPDWNRKKVYDEIYSRYVRLYQAVRPLV